MPQKAAAAPPSPANFQHGNDAKGSHGEQRVPHSALPSPSKDISAIIIYYYYYFFIPERVIQTSPAKFNSPGDGRAMPLLPLPAMPLQVSSLAKHFQAAFGAKSVIKPKTVQMFSSRRAKS